ncbi:hypothetical protein NE237_026932 [Protea cynaroides]|uniref:Uncharacterized protein n=1 Tax=Protea cynaroides TaxID=273540 RepID=A0A9Q0GMF4_9MAGN|nr:hypothetical protein NE237_026932 [Protea cynaroides]
MSTFSIISSPGLTESDNKSHTQRSLKSSTTRFLQVNPLDDFDIAFVDLDCLDQVIIHLEKLLDVGFFRRLLLEELAWGDTVHKGFSALKIKNSWSFSSLSLLQVLVFSNRYIEGIFFDRRTILHYVALFLFVTYVLDEMQEKRLGKVIGEMLKVVPVIYSEGGFRLMLLDLLRNQFPPSLSLWPILKDAARDSDAVKKNYLVHLDEMHSRDWQTMKDALAYWIASFQSTLHPVIL